MRGRAAITMTCALLLLVLGTGCNGPNSKYEDFGKRVNTRGFGHKFAQPEDQDELVLGPGDVVTVQIANLPELDSTQPLTIEGHVHAPFVGPVKAGGLTATQIRDKLVVLLTPYVRDISLQVIPVSIRSKRIYVWTTGRFGELVGRAIGLQGDMTLMDLMTMIGGSSLLDDCHIRVVRADPRHPEVLDINFREMVLEGFSAGNIQMKPDDIVYLPPTFFAKVSQALNTLTMPIRVVSRSLRDASTAILFVEDGIVPRGRNGAQTGGGF